MGLTIGLVLALAARLGRWPTLSARELLRPICVLLVVMGISALVSGVAGYDLSRDGVRTIPAHVAGLVPSDKHNIWMGVWYAHNASYNVAGLGGIVLVVLALGARWRRARLMAAAAR